MHIDSKPTLMGPPPPPTSHFHILAGLQPINPPKTAQPSAARTMIDLDGKRVDKKDEDGTDFGHKTDQVRDFLGQKTILVFLPCQQIHATCLTLVEAPLLTFADVTCL